MKKILWIEDNPELIARFRDIIAENGWTLYEALELCDADFCIETAPGIDEIDIIISDINMPDYDFEGQYAEYSEELYDRYGMDLYGLVWIKRFLDTNPNFPRGRIAFLSGFLDGGVIEEIRESAPGVLTLDKLSFRMLDELIAFISSVK